MTSLKKDVFSSSFAENIFRQKYSMDGQETWSETCKRVVDTVTGQYLPQELKQEILEAMLDRKFIPGGRYLYSSGRQFHQVNNCFLFRAEDSREGWADAMQKATAALMTGGGIGFDYSALREQGAIIKRTGGTSTGPLALIHMVNEAGRYIMQGGSRRCLPTGTLIHTEKGLVEIDKIEIGTSVITTEGYKKILGKIKQGTQKTVKIQTQNGELICTPNHRVAVVTSVYGDYEWVEAKNLKEGDRLYFLNKAITGEKTNLPENNFIKSEKAHNLKRITLPELDTGIAWLIGLLHGDGHVHLTEDEDGKKGKRHGRVSIACGKDRPEIKDKAVEQLSRFGIEVKIKEGDGAIWNVVAHSVELASYFRQFKAPKTEMNVPNCIKLGLGDIRAAYIAGLMDADGSNSHRPINIMSQVYPNFLKEVQTLVSSLGIATRLKSVRKAKENWQELYQLNVSTGKQLTLFKELIGKYGHKCAFPIPSKTQHHSYSLPSEIVNLAKITKHRGKGINTSIERIEKEIGKQQYTPITVKSVSEFKELETWDIEVEGKQEFITNGYLVHNSAIWAGLNWSHPDVHAFMKSKDHSEDLKKLKEKDISFPLPLDGTNISVNYDTEFFIAIENKKHPKHKEAMRIWLENCKQAFSTAEPGMAFNFCKDSESLRNACTEVTSEDDSDKCNLGTVWLNNCKDKNDFERVCFIATVFLLCGGLYSDVPTEKIKEVGNKNNRIGLGLGGLHEWLMQRGEKYEVTPELHKWLRAYELSSDSAAYIWSKELGVAIPKGKRAIAPNGSIGILAETTTGLEPLFCKAYKRRYLKDNEWVYEYVVDGTVKSLLERGIKLEQIIDSYDISFEDRVKFQADIQNYVDMSISSTCNLPAWGSESNNEETLKKNAKILLKYAKRLRGFTCYPDGCRGGQPLTRISLEEALGKEGVIFEEKEQECLNGVCGI